MAVTELMLDGARLLVLGMGSVFIFLGVLVVAMRIMSWLAARLGAEDEEVLVAATQPPVRDSGVDANIIPVITAAVAVWRQRRS